MMHTYILSVGLASRNNIPYGRRKRKNVERLVASALDAAAAVVHTRAQGRGIYNGAEEPCATWVFSTDLHQKLVLSIVRHHLVSAGCGDQDCFYLAQAVRARFEPIQEEK